MESEGEKGKSFSKKRKGVRVIVGNQKIIIYKWDKNFILKSNREIELDLKFISMHEECVLEIPIICYNKN